MTESEKAAWREVDMLRTQCQALAAELQETKDKLAYLSNVRDEVEIDADCIPSYPEIAPY